MWNLAKKMRLFMSPPQVGDQYDADPFDFIIGKPVERVLHGLVAPDGDSLWDAVPSHGCYRIRIQSTIMPYYICTAEALCRSADGDNTEWKSRSQLRRMSKAQFHQMIIEGRLTKCPDEIL